VNKYLAGQLDIFHFGLDQCDLVLKPIVLDNLSAHVESELFLPLRADTYYTAKSSGRGRGKEQEGSEWRYIARRAQGENDSRKQTYLAVWMMVEQSMPYTCCHTQLHKAPTSQQTVYDIKIGLVPVKYKWEGSIFS